MTVTIPAELQRFVSEALASGKYSSENEVLTAALSLLRRREQRLEKLRAEVKIGADELKNGEFFEFTDESLPQLFEDIKEEGRARLEKRNGAS